VGASCVYLERLPASQTDIDFALRYNKCTALVATPIILEEMIPYLEEKKDLSAIQRLKYIISGGAPLKREVGDWFQDHSVHICSLYGSTEMGVSMLANLDPQSKNWYSVRSIYSGHNEKRYIAFEEEGDGLKHLYVTADCPHLAIDVINRPDGGYNSNDLFEEDPDNPGYYIHRGRRDDILLMENGEKTNPVPMENTIRQSPIVKQVAVLGSGRKCTLALISIDTEYAMDYSPEEMISMVHKAVRKANEECPSHSTILPKMVKILPLSKPLPTTDKGNVMRKRAEMIYKDIVEKTYKEFLEGSVDEPNDGSSWSNEQIESFLVRNSADVLNLPEPSVYNHQGSLFDLGLNSLTAIQLRNIIANYFRDVPRNFLFQYSTLSSMKEALITKKQEDAAVLVEKRYQQTQALAQSYIDRAAKDFPVAENKYKTEEKESVVLLTGATGSLGAFILRNLLRDPQVKKVYCLVRGKEAELYDRLIKSFKSRHLDISLLNPERVEALPMRLNEPYLGLTKEYYEQLKGEVTIVQHCAWLLDFNMTIEHYDRECISSFYTLLKFAYRQANPMHVHFISSVSASAALASEIEERPLPFDSHSAMPMGYAQSKFVCEILLNYLTRQKNFPCYVERVGQISGDSENGVWNTSEQYPMLFVSGGALMRKMPKLSTEIDWVPVDYASAAIVDIMLRTAHLKADEESSIYHIVNPQTKSWSDVIDTMRSCGMDFDLVDTTEWIEALSKDHSLPAFRLLAFYEDSFKSGFRMPYYQTKKTCKMAPVLGQSPMIDSELFKKYLHHWQSVGFYSLSN
jgi:thioester reductase-like protein